MAGLSQDFFTGERQREMTGQWGVPLQRPVRACLVRGTAGTKPPFKTPILSAGGLHRPEAVRPRGGGGELRVLPRRAVSCPLPTSPAGGRGTAAHRCLSALNGLWYGEESLIAWGRPPTGCRGVPRRCPLGLAPACSLSRRPPSVVRPVLALREAERSRPKLSWAVNRRLPEVAGLSQAHEDRRAGAEVGVGTFSGMRCVAAAAPDKSSG